jgi:hypothetical protein
MRISELLPRPASTRTTAYQQVMGGATVRDGTLVIDCRQCLGAKDLTDQSCMRCALKSMCRLPSIDRLVLSASLDVAYEGGCVQVLRELAEAVRLCREEALLPLERSCSNCPVRPSLLLQKVADSIPYEWDGHALRAKPAQPRARCASCSERANDVLTAVLAKMRSIERSSSREAFMVVGESGHA